MAIHITKTPIGLALPIKRGNNGYFEQTYDTFSQKKTNIINLLKTKPGERRFQPEFGCRLYSLVFEQNTEMLTEQAKQIIAEDISTWINGIEINSINVTSLKNEQSNRLTDIYRLYIRFDFTDKTTKYSDNIELVVDLGTI